MPKQTNNSSNNAALKGFALTLVILILAVCVMAAMTEGFSNWNPYGWFDKPAEEQQTPEGNDPTPEEPTEETAPIEATISNSEHVALAMSAAVTAADGYTKSVTLTATVMPEDAPDKSVDWSIAWNEAPTYGSNPVTDYVTVTPQSDGSNVATVTCLKPFALDTIIITCTTRVGGFTATAQVSYAGFPTELGFTTSSMTGKVDSGWGGITVYEAQCGNTYSIPITLDNGFHAIGEDFVPSYTIEVTAKGDVKYRTISTTYNRNGGVVSSTSEDKTQAYDSDIIGAAAYGSKNLGNAFEDTISVELSEGQLKIVPKAALSALSYTDTRTSTHYIRSTDFQPADASKVPYVEIKVTETKTGISQTIAVRVIATVNSIELDLPSIVF